MFKDVLKQLRKEKHLTQEQLSRELGLAPSSIGNYEQGTRTPKYETLETIADYFNVRMDTLLSSSNRAYVSRDSVAYKIIAFMNYRNISMEKLAEKIGCSKEVLEQYIYDTPDYEFNDKNELFEKIAKALDLSPSKLLDFNIYSDDTYENYIGFLYNKAFNNEPMTDNERKTLANYINDVPNISLKEPEITTDIVAFPVIGEIAAGYDHYAYEDWNGETVEIPTSYLQGRKKEEFFVLSVKGDSMYPLYMNGDKVLILRQSTLNHSGQIGAIIYEDYATLKKIEYVQGEDWLKMIPINPQYQPKKIEGSDLELCHILGIPRLVIREIDE